jgi:eukaryotic-like serine/threonine-protein kinase
MRLDALRKILIDLAKGWVENNQSLPLLDGLDEVREENRPACVEAINRFHHENVPTLAVCCRAADYRAIGSKLELKAAVSVQTWPERK